MILVQIVKADLFHSGRVVRIFSDAQRIEVKFHRALISEENSAPLLCVLAGEEVL